MEMDQPPHTGRVKKTVKLFIYVSLYWLVKWDQLGYRSRIWGLAVSVGCDAWWSSSNGSWFGILSIFLCSSFSNVILRPHQRRLLQFGNVRCLHELGNTLIILMLIWHLWREVLLFWLHYLSQKRCHLFDPLPLAIFIFLQILAAHTCTVSIFSREPVEAHTFNRVSCHCWRTLSISHSTFPAISFYIL